jgi:hypothetical protein
MYYRLCIFVVITFFKIRACGPCFRLLLAALHFSENSSQTPIEEDDGSGVKLTVEYVKYMKGKGKAVRVRPETTNSKFLLHFNKVFTE